MKKYFYFGVQRSKAVTDSTGRTRNVPVVIWGKPYASAEEALAANSKFVCDHLGERFLVQGFERPLLIEADGTSKGFIKEAQ